MAVNLLLTLVVLLVSLAASTSRSLLHQPDAKTGFQVKLKHVDWGRNFTKLELIQRGMKRGRERMERLHAMALAASDASIQAPIHAGKGEFLMELSIGTPPSPYSAILDTGSDLIWTQCKPCKRCFHQPTPVFDPETSSSFSTLSCSSDLCTALPKSSCSNRNCDYFYSYADRSSTQGVLATETFTFGEVSVPQVGFGCGNYNKGKSFGGGAGLVGLGRGPLSLVSQLDEPKFSYCLTSIDSTKTSTLLTGSLVNTPVTTSTKTTPLIKNPSLPSFYYLSLEGITVGDTRLPIDKSAFAIRADGTGGLIIDSGTTFTHIQEGAFDLVKKEFINQLQLPVDESNQTGFELCFTRPSSAHQINVPKLVFHFQGADLELPKANYIYTAGGVACLAIHSFSGMSTFGNFQQQNIQVIHDLVQETISFVPTQCDQM